MFERYTDRARRVVVLAQMEARMLNHNYIGTEHLLLGLIREGDGMAAKALEALGISLEGIRGQVEEIIGRGQQAPSGHIPFTPRAKKCLELSLREALQLNHNYIGTEHLLLGLIREGDGAGAKVLKELGAELTKVRQQVTRLLTGYQPRTSAPQGSVTGHLTGLAAVADEIARLRAELDALSHVARIERRLEECRKRKGEQIDALDLEGASKTRDEEKALTKQLNEARAKHAAIGSTTATELGGGGLGAKHAKQGDDFVAAKASIDVPDGPLFGHERANLPKVSVDKDQFEELKSKLAYVVTDPFSGEIRLYPPKWVGRAITGVDWEGRR